MKIVRLRRLVAIAAAATCFGALASAVPAGARANTAGEYVAVAPTRILDTRVGNGAPTGPIGPTGRSTFVDLQVTGRGGIPTSGAVAVVMNVTVASPTVESYLSVWPTGEDRPVVSSLNFVPTQTVPNLVTVKLGAGGKVSFFNPLGSADILADVVGFYDDASITGGWYNPLTPSRSLDTRSGIGASTSPLGPGGSLTLQVTGRNGVPAASQVSAVAINVTAVEPTGTGFVTVWPGGAQPNVSNLNFVAGRTIANLVIVGVSSTGTINFFNEAGNTNLIGDVVGWFDKTGSAGLVFTPVSPVRAVDTRTGNGAPIGADQGPWAPPVVGAHLDTAKVKAIVMNVTATETTAESYFTVYPANVTTRPDASNLNWKAGQTVPNLVMSPVSPTGVTGVDPGLTAVYNAHGQAHLVMDVVGYFSTAP